VLKQYYEDNKLSTYESKINMKIKQKHEDFIVEEISTVKPQKSGEYTYIQVKKTNWTTQRAVQQVARNLRVSRTRIGFAGNKDKNAITTQVCSVWKTSPEQIKHINIKDIEVKVLGQGDERITLGELIGNRFQIKVREVSEEELIKLKVNFPKIKKEGFLNIFGSQRFGTAGTTHKIGNAIVNGNLKEAVKLFLTEHGDNEVAQAFGKYTRRHWGDWKKVINECPNFLGLEKAVLNWLVKYPKDFGGALRSIPKPTRRIFISAYQSAIWNKEAEKSEKEIIIIPPIEIKRMPELNMRGAERQRVIKPKKLTYKVSKDVVSLSFDLQKGSYATVLIDALFSS
jgi:tRNA pseudouridine13 synthase